LIDLTGRTAIVTGGSRGIGRAAARALAAAGANVAIGYHSDHSAAGTLLEELHLSGRHAVASAGNLCLRESVERLFQAAVNAFGAIDIVVANAGIWKRAPIESMTDRQWQETLDTNLKSAYLLCQAAAREMIPRRAGKIILISSTAGQRGEPFYSHYAASKGAIIALTKSLAGELGRWNIHVNAVAPGWVMTDMTAEVMQDDRFREAATRHIPLGRIATPDDVAGPVLFLASQLADHVHGEVLNVNGGSVLCG
jgi:3-oxoacyl-[acyl-carrier protein] reductase